MSSNDKNVRVLLDFDLTKGNSEQVIVALRKPEVLAQLQNFVVNVLAEGHEEFDLRKLSAYIHGCFSEEVPCAECRRASEEWRRGVRTYGR